MPLILLLQGLLCSCSFSPCQVAYLSMVLVCWGMHCCREKHRANGKQPPRLVEKGKLYCHRINDSKCLQTRISPPLTRMPTFLDNYGIAEEWSAVEVPSLKHCTTNSTSWACQTANSCWPMTKIGNRTYPEYHARDTWIICIAFKQYWNMCSGFCRCFYNKMCKIWQPVQKQQIGNLMSSFGATRNVKRFVGSKEQSKDLAANSTWIQASSIK